MTRYTVTRILNRKGQVAIFIALIFQVLFLFFAMIINVGLLVHHKINLQNSVDLAAYYGAMKQAEMLNAVGHVNYQIRQSWKLLSWRYRQLGTAGDYGVHPYDKVLRQIRPDDIEGLPQPSAMSTEKDYYDAPAFCITYSPFSPMPKGESTCKLQSKQRTINLFSPPPTIAGFFSINEAIRKASDRALSEALDRCRYVGQFNFVILAEFMAAYNIDQGERKELINLLSRGLSEKEDDFREINGELASKGIDATLKNNLTSANRDSVKYKIFNGLGATECNAVGQVDKDPPKWLSEIKIKPAFIYMDYDCLGNTSPPQVEPHPKELTSQNLPRYTKELAQDVDYLKQLADPLQAPYNSSLGYEKNPWCMAYVGISAESTPNIPFAPLGGVTLKARSFAKPFGGKIGPWYYSQWPRGSKQSSGGKRTDPLLPWREGDKSQTADYKDPTRAANYSRFVGDKAGMKSRAVMGQYGRAIFNLSSAWSGKPPTPSDLDPSIPPDWRPSAEPNFYHWSHLGQSFKAEKSGDILAWDNYQNSPPRMRYLELAAILPDQFDLTYYSIDPDYYHNYYLKIVNEYIKVVPGFHDLVRPDLGARLGNKSLEEFSIREQYKALDFVKTENPQINEPKVDFETKILYTAKDVYQVLTSWVGKDLSDYSLDPEKFGKCKVGQDKSKNLPTSGDCNNGGRTGYSVKLISSEYVKAGDLELGGENSGQGNLLNPPPSDF
ncbi:MAG: TadE/TadG family type IV pilus assembly protein [Pseudobdellovibrionaceae bacterium]